jgi:putative nucleotidyltransferase with HDIG domain
LVETLHLFYRVRQFWQAVTVTPAIEDMEMARQALSEQEMALFLNQQTSEQVHSLKVFIKMCEHGEQSPELLSAALLHDVGKSRYTLRIWERAVVVIGSALAPGHSESWGWSEPRGWKRPFAIAGQHAEWGAKMAEAAGASPLTVELIRRHHDPVNTNHTLPIDSLLGKLQFFDHMS